MHETITSLMIYGNQVTLVSGTSTLIFVQRFLILLLKPTKTTQNFKQMYIQQKPWGIIYFIPYHTHLSEHHTNKEIHTILFTTGLQEETKFV